MLYNSVPQPIPACSAPGQHHKNDTNICTIEAFLKHAKSMSLNEDEYQKVCFSETVVKQDWD
jgi:hypothetical protein